LYIKNTILNSDIDISEIIEKLNENQYEWHKERVQYAIDDDGIDLCSMSLLLFILCVFLGKLNITLIELFNNHGLEPLTR